MGTRVRPRILQKFGARSSVDKRLKISDHSAEFTGNPEAPGYCGEDAKEALGTKRGRKHGLWTSKKTEILGPFRELENRFWLRISGNGKCRTSLSILSS